MYLEGIFLWLIAAIFYGLDYLQHTAPSVLILPISKSLGINFISIANTMNIYFPVYAISQIPAGYLIERYGLRKTLSIACLIVSIGLFIMSISSLDSILFGRILIAMGSAFAFIGGLKAAAIYLPNKIFPLMVGLLQSIGVIGGLIGEVFLDSLLKNIGWQNTIYYLSIFGVFWAIIIYLFLKNKSNKKKQNNDKTNIKKKDILKILQDKKVWILAFYAAFIVGSVMSAFAETYSVIILEKIKHFSSHHAAWLSSMIILGVGVGAPLQGLISAKFKNKANWLIIASIITLLIYVIIIAYIYSNQTTDLIAIVYFLLGFFVSTSLLVFTIGKESHANEHQGIIFAFLNMMIGLGGFFIPFLFGEIINIFSASIITSALCLSIPIIISVLLAFRCKISI
jgi:predicted MFS family arabinose efflux permease